MNTPHIAPFKFQDTAEVRTVTDVVPLAIAGIGIRQDAQGRYCLNDLHKAAGGEDRHGPSYWTETQQTKDLVAEISNSRNSGNYPIESSAGRYGGTFVCKELVYAYAMWISAKFHLQVIRAYDALVQQQVQMQQPPIMHTPLTADLAAVDALARLLNVAPSGRIAMARVALEHSAPHLLPALPGYAVHAPSDVLVSGSGSAMPTASATELLKRHNVKMSTARFNELLESKGFLHQGQRTSSRGGLKHYWCVTVQGEKYGKNLVSTQNTRETQPHWYVDRFGALLKAVGVVE